MAEVFNFDRNNLTALLNDWNNEMFVRIFENILVRHTNLHFPESTQVPSTFYCRPNRSVFLFQLRGDEGRWSGAKLQGRGVARLIHLGKYRDKERNLPNEEAGTCTNSFMVLYPWVSKTNLRKRAELGMACKLRPHGLHWVKYVPEWNSKQNTITTPFVLADIYECLHHLSAILELYDR